MGTTTAGRTWSNGLSAPGRARQAKLLFVLGLLAGGPLSAALCSVPGTHADLRCALTDLACSDIALAAGTFTVDLVTIERDVVLHGAGPGATTVVGQMAIAGATSDVALSDFRLDASGATVGGCAEPALATSGGAQVTSGAGLEVIDAIPAGACRLFFDGFEGGSRCAWSFSTP